MTTRPSSGARGEMITPVVDPALDEALDASPRAGVWLGQDLLQVLWVTQSWPCGPGAHHAPPPINGLTRALSTALRRECLSGDRALERPRIGAEQCRRATRCPRPQRRTRPSMRTWQSGASGTCFGPYPSLWQGSLFRSSGPMCWWTGSVERPPLAIWFVQYGALATSVLSLVQAIESRHVRRILFAIAFIAISFGWVYSHIAPEHFGSCHDIALYNGTKPTARDCEPLAASDFALLIGVVFAFLILTGKASSALQFQEWERLSGRLRLGRQLGT